MSVFDRYTSNVGDADPVWRYLLEKIGHVAAISWAIVCLTRWSPLWVAVAAAIAYDVLGKALWLWSSYRYAGELRAQSPTPTVAIPRFMRREDGRPVDFWFELRDALFDLAVGLVPASFAGFLDPAHPLREVAATLILWVFLAVAFNNRWSSPGKVG